MHRTTLFALALLSASAFTVDAGRACDALAGTTTWDSSYGITGDPFFGGHWSNAQGGSAYIQRTLATPAKISGFFMRYAGSDITADGAQIVVKARLASTGTWTTLMNVSNIAIGRDFSGGIVPRRMAPITVTFPEITVNAIRVDMKGHGWFAMDQTLFFVRGCSA